MSTLNKWIYDQNINLRDKNSIFHPVQWNSCEAEIGKFYLVTNPRMTKYSNKIWIFSSSVYCENQEGGEPKLDWSKIKIPAPKEKSRENTRRKPNYSMCDKGEL